MTAADQTPATDSERAIALCSADDTREHHDQTDDHPCTRCQQTTDSERDERLRGIQERVDHHSPEEFGSETVGWLLALLAEQAATIREQVAQAIEAERDAQAALRPISDAMYYGYTKAADAARTAALGSQRTEGQG